MRLPVQQTLMSAKKHAKKGDMAKAKSLYLSILAKFPKNKPAQAGLAALDGMKNPPADKGLQDQINTVVALYRQGRAKEVLDHATRILMQHPRTVLLHNILGATYIGLGQIEAAIDSFKRALQIDPQSVQARNNLGGALKQKGDLPAAIECYQTAVRLEPENAELHNNLGIALSQNGDIEAAEKCYLQAMQINPDNLKFITSLCDFYEKTNNLSGLADVLAASQDKAACANSNLLYYATVLKFREKKYDAAKAILDRITPDQLIKKRLIAFYELKGKLFDKLGLYDAAFDAFSKMNSEVANGPGFSQADPDGYFTRISSDLKELKDAPSLPKALKQQSPPLPDTPYFLVGFPRSGTTLLDTILRSHSRVLVAEELPMVAATRNALDAKTGLAEMERLSADKVSALQSEYFAELGRHFDTPVTNRVFIDKLPLNALETPLIHAAFPHAKFILAIRHPYDAILSCYMQYFKLNPQMANLVNLDRIVDYYCVTMDMWATAQERYDLNHHMIRYEDLVADMPTEIAKLVDFLGLDWEDALHEYQKTARERGKINTPSYSQVVQPLYKDATYRWKNYRKYLGRYDAQIQPWIQRFGY
jgi:tetratricopeptide (TPR) repeat protein